MSTAVIAFLLPFANDEDAAHSVIQKSRPPSGAVLHLSGRGGCAGRQAECYQSGKSVYRDVESEGGKAPIRRTVSRFEANAMGEMAIILEVRSLRGTPGDLYEEFCGFAPASAAFSAHSRGRIFQAITSAGAVERS